MTSPAFTLDSLFTSRSLKQYWQSLVARMFYPSCRADVVQELRRRARLGGEVSCSCRCEHVSTAVCSHGALSRCGALTVVCQAAPRLVTVCHCSVCRSGLCQLLLLWSLSLLRYDEALSLKQDDAPAPSFAAVPRQSCWLKVSQNYRNENLLIFRHSSDFARRGRCKVYLVSINLYIRYNYLISSSRYINENG